VVVVPVEVVLLVVLVWSVKGLKKMKPDRDEHDPDRRLKTSCRPPDQSGMILDPPEPPVKPPKCSAQGRSEEPLVRSFDDRTLG
jgi:hypothetical protein